MDDAIRSFPFRQAALVAAACIYALWGTPTPETFGLAEGLIAALLIVAAGGWGVARLFRAMPQAASWEKAGRALLLYGLSVPVLAGIAAGSPPGLMFRDILPFFFFLLPVFLAPLLRDADRRLMTALVAAAGLVFALRLILPLLLKGTPLYLAAPADPFYLANAPTVLFAALLMLGLVGKELYDRGMRPQSALKALVLVSMALFPLAAMSLITQRASVGVLILSAAILTAIGLFRNPARVLLPVTGVALAIWAGWDLMAAVGEDLARKTALVGVNMRWQEMQAVLDELDGSMLHALFGRGWGATFASPAVGGVTVNFTHSLITTYWLKTGLCGLALALHYLFRLGLLGLRLLPVHLVLALAIAGPVLIDVFLYASFKSLDFGLVLLLIPLWAVQLHNYDTGDTLPEEIPA